MKTIDTAPEGVWILTYADWTEPRFGVSRLKLVKGVETRLVTAVGRRRTYEDVDVIERTWEGEHHEPTHWAELPEEPK
jgi:hypothetical protein